MKRLLSFLTVLFLLIPTAVDASSTRVNSIDINCQIDQNGTATFVEKWDMDVSEGTEGYKIFNGMSDQPLKLIGVTDDRGKTYTNIGSWNSDLSKEYKTNKCGLIRDGGHYELCFGLGDYGRRSYTMTYQIDHFVNQYEDQQGINYAFISDMALNVGDVTIRVSGITPYSKDNAKIWAFGYSGSVNFDDGSVVLQTHSLNSNKMQLLMGLESNAYASPNQRYSRKKFEKVVNEAKEGSSYSKGMSKAAKIMLFIFITFVIVMVIFIIVAVIVFSDSGVVFENGRTIKGKEVTPFREIPCDKDIFLFYYLAKKLDIIGDDESRENLISGFILKWVRDGVVTIREKESGAIVKKKNYDMYLDVDVKFENKQESALYKMFILASKDGVLQTKAFQKWCGKHYKKIDSWFTKVDNIIEDSMNKNGYAKTATVYKRVLFWNIPRDRTVWTNKAYDQCLYVWGFNNFLKDEDNMKEKAAIEVKLWDEYLIFAAVLGIADRVEKQLKVAIPRYEEMTTYNSFPIYYYTHTFAHNSMSAATAAASAGQGGSSSFSGGGSSFSGGGGGGVR
ncbi:DUF2207 domain-containing protein [uncultured Catenibacterium sp.]|uniref:DUF2207 family protein n=1 Tax=uncultured Catenibacterium sp. TaxID=286142 RepID=UPI00263301B4|nr:DUF2207 domain-containing protein [uncultured Catenibacterium sp.]